MPSMPMPVLFQPPPDAALRRVERELADAHARNARLAMVAARITNGVVVTDAAGRTEWVNEGFTRLSGYTLGDLRGRVPGHVLQGPDTDPATVARVRAGLAAREPFSAELLNVHKNGTPYWVQIDVTPLVEDDGALTGFMAIETDVTERRAAEASLRASEARFRLVTETAGVGMFISDIENRQTDFTLPGHAVLGYEEAEPLTFERFNELVHPDDRERIGEAIARAKDPDGPGRIDLAHRVTRPDTGEVRWVTVRAEAVFEGDGAARRPTQLCGVILDATEQKRAEVAIRASEARYRTLVESVRDAVIETDAEGHITFVNPAWERITGVSPEAARGRLARTFVHPDAHAEHDAQFARLVAGEIPFVRFESRIARPDGEVRHVEVQTSLRHTKDGGWVGTIGTVTDITDAARFEAEREARQRSDEMLRLKDAFLSNMSHELRTPLTGILGFAEVLAEEVGEAQQEWVEAILRGGRRLQDTLNALLDLAQLEADVAPLEPARVDAQAELAEAAARARPLAEQAGLALDVAEGPPAFAQADASALRSVLDHVVGNAVKFTPSGRVLIAADADGGRVRLRVSDTGIGIPPGSLERVFDEFTQVSDGHARTHEGNGLGLTISRRLVERMGGEMRLESAPGVGTTVSVLLPAGEPS